MDSVKEIIFETGLWQPQQLSLRKLHSVLSSVDLSASLPEIEASIAGNIKFDTAFPSFCFALATGTGKTKLMGACIAYLFRAHGMKNFFVLAPGETIYTKLNQDFKPGSAKWVFAGLSGWPNYRVVNGENYDLTSTGDGMIHDELTIYIFNIQKIFNERQDVEFRFHKFRETLGSSFADLLRAKNDLVVLMDESHRYRGEKSLRAIAALKPRLGLEFTATPTSQMHNVIQEFSLRTAIQKGFVKKPVVITRRDDDSLIEEREEIKLKDGIKRHRRKKVLLQEYCSNNKKPLVTPLALISTRDINHSHEVETKVTASDFYGGEYKNKTLVVHSDSPDEAIQRLLALELPENKVEIVIHVNKLKEGWDVKNLYTIIPLRASVSEILTVQTIGRGLRLPFGELTKEKELDTLEIISHDKFKKVVDQAGRLLDVMGVEARQDDDEPELESRTISPVENSAFAISIPKIRTTFHQKGRLKIFKPVFKGQFVQKDVALVGQEIESKEMTELEKIAPEIKTNPVIFIVRALIDSIDQVDAHDKATLQTIVKDFLRQISLNEKKWPEIVAQNAESIRSSLGDQISETVDSQTTVKHTRTKNSLEFVEYQKAVPKGYTDRNKKTVSDADIKRQHVIGGYKRTMFLQNIFFSRQEKICADILDADTKNVKCWLRIPEGQLVIKTKVGGYRPDFLVEEKDGFYVLEIKDADSVQQRDPEVFEKAKESERWCKAMKQATGNEWSYKLIPHDKVNPQDSFRGLINAAVSIE